MDMQARACILEFYEPSKNNDHCMVEFEVYQYIY